ncbi:RalA-binding protein 1 [Aphelenchoides besseyi]|nr:RalA-binding protein 1 [Aphelenchoides besseyi]KAI6207829.1 RalA-binding protein 1 [Aphelenchoides besseyi]
MIFRRGKEKKGSGDEQSERASNSMRLFNKRNHEPTRPVFGVSLSTAVLNSRCHDGLPIPLLVRECIDYITANGLKDEGIYRISASKNKLDELERAANYGDPIVFSHSHDAADLLKRFIRQLPEHILTEKLRERFRETAINCKCGDQNPCTCEVVEQLAECTKLLPRENFYLLGYVFRHAQDVIMNSEENKMNLKSLGTILQAALNLITREVRIFLLNASSAMNLTRGPIVELFAEVQFQPYAKPKNAHEIAHTVIIPSEEELVIELRKQESLLADLHEQLRYTTDKKQHDSKSHLIWDVQNTITVLKRQLKQIGNSGSTKATTSNSEQPGPSNDNPLVQLSNQPPPAFVEKQLIASHTSLEAEITEEKRNAANLLSRLREIKKSLPPEALEALEKSSSVYPSNNANEISTLNAEYEELDEQKTKLLAEVAKYRDLCAQLRARLEHYTVILNTVRHAKNGEEIVAGCLSVGGVVPMESAQSTIPEDPNVTGGSLLITRF